MVEPLALAEEWLFAAIPAVGFAMLFNVPQKALKYCALLGGCGHVLRTLIFHLPADKAFATLVASVAVSCAGIVIGRRERWHPKIITIASIIPMFPGLPAYRAMISLIEIHSAGYTPLLNEQLISSFLQLAFQLGALAGGLALPGLLFFRSRPVV